MATGAFALFIGVLGIHTQFMSALAEKFDAQVHSGRIGRQGLGGINIRIITGRSRRHPAFAQCQLSAAMLTWHFPAHGAGAGDNSLAALTDELQVHQVS